jgi:hypothetical protein
MADITQHGAAIGAWKNFTCSKCLKNKNHYRSLFLCCLIFVKQNCLSWTGTLARLFANISAWNLIILSILSLFILGRSCIRAHRSSLSTSWYKASSLIYNVTALASLTYMLYLVCIKLSTAGYIHPNPGPEPPSQSNTFFVSHLNVQSLVSEVSPDPTPHDQNYIKVDEIFKQQIYDNKADIITLSETWLDGTISDDDITLTGYVIFRRNRDRHGGGVMVYARESIPVKRRYDLELKDIECIWLEINTLSGILLVGAYYRPPGTSEPEKDLFLTSLQTSIDMALATNSKSILILGDLTFYNSHTESELKNRLVNLVRTNDFRQLIDQPTRITATSEYLLDLIITDSPGYILNSGVTIPICNVDHHGVFCKLKLKSYTDSSFERKIYNYEAADYIRLRETLSYAPWDTGILLFDDINDIVTYYYNIFKDVVNEFIPNKIIKVRSRDKEWMRQYILRLINVRDRLRRRFSKNKSPHNLELYKQARTEAKDAINNAKCAYFSRMIQRLQDPETVPKEYHKLCKRFFYGKSQNGIPPIIDNTIIHASPISKATVLNNYFAENSTLIEPTDAFALPPLQFKTDYEQCEWLDCFYNFIYND